jgi:hypothetical protein
MTEAAVDVDTVTDAGTYLFESISDTNPDCRNCGCAEEFHFPGRVLVLSVGEELYGGKGTWCTECRIFCITNPDDEEADE